MRRRHPLSAPAIGIALAALAGGLLFRAFTDPVPADVLRTLRPGMTEGEVRALLGPPTKVYPSGQWTYSRPLVFGYVSLSFHNGRLVGEVNFERF